MAFFEQLGKRITDAGQGVAQQTKNLADVTRLNSAISEKEKKISQLYLAIGQTYYENHQQSASSDLQPLIEQIHTLRTEMAQCQEEIKQIKGVVRCAACGAEVPLHAAFCNTCGAKIVPNEAAQKRNHDQILCPSCGQSTSRENTFCSHCGTKLRNPQN